MIGQDCAGVAGVGVLAKRSGKSGGDEGDLGGVESQHGKDQPFGGPLVKIADFQRRRLDSLAAVVPLAQFRQLGRGYGVRTRCREDRWEATCRRRSTPGGRQ